jgi:hypothetical protein
MFKNNWAQWTYDNKVNATKDSPDSEFNFQFTIPNETIDHRTLLTTTAVEIYEENKKLDVLFSGGINSQLILQTYKNLGISVTAKIFKYENDLNHYWDVAAATKFCKDLDIKYELIDFNLKNFFEKDAYDIFTKCYNIEVSNLPLMKMIDYCDNVPVLGTGYPYISRSNLYYNTPAEWNLQIFESDINFCSYAKNINRSVISNWFLYSGELLGSLLQHPSVIDLMDDKITAVVNLHEIRNTIYNDLHIPIRLKQKGFEDQKNGFLYPDYMQSFYSTYIKDTVKSAVIKLPLRY